MPRPVVLVAQLFVAPGHQADFEAFEARAAAVMARHGGTMERRIRVQGEETAGEPTEVHIVTFPDRGALDAYRGDPDLASLAELRSRAIRKTVIWAGEDLRVFGA